MKEWQFINIVSDGQAISIDGINPWKHEWISLNEETIDMPHPNYPNQRHKMCVYKIEAGSKSIVFAAGEYSNCVWGFYVPCT